MLRFRLTLGMWEYCFVLWESKGFPIPTDFTVCHAARPSPPRTARSPPPAASVAPRSRAAPRRSRHRRRSNAPRDPPGASDTAYGCRWVCFFFCEHRSWRGVEIPKGTQSKKGFPYFETRRCRSQSRPPIGCSLKCWMAPSKHAWWTNPCKHAHQKVVEQTPNRAIRCFSF